MSLKPDPDVIPFSAIISPRQDTAIPAIYSERRTQAILKKPEDYYLAVTGVRFDTTNIPIMQFPSKADLVDPNTSNLFITLIYSPAPAVFQAYQQYVKYNPYSTISPPVLITDNSSNPYYNIFEPRQYVLMVNNAINAAFQALITVNPGLSPTVKAPYFFYDANLGKLILNIQNVINPLVPGVNVYETQYDVNNNPLYNASQPAGTIQMYANIDLFRTVGTYDYAFTNLFNMEYLVLVNNEHPELSPAYFQYPQSDNFLDLNNPIARFAILSDALPIVQTDVPTVTENPVGIPSKYRFIFDLYQNNISEDATFGRNFVDYNQQGYLRIYEMQGNEPLEFMSFQFVYIDHQQNINQIFVSPHDCCSISLVFIKKSLFRK